MTSQAVVIFWIVYEQPGGKSQTVCPLVSVQQGDDLWVMHLDNKLWDAFSFLCVNTATSVKPFFLGPFQ